MLFRSEDPNAEFRRKRYSLVPSMVPGTERGLPFGDSLQLSPGSVRQGLEAAGLKAAEARFQETAGVVVGTFGDMAAAALRGSGQIKSSILSMIGGILERTTKNPLLGGFLGGAFAIGAALFSRSEKPRVVVEDYGSAAERKMSAQSKRPIRITNIIESGGRPIAEIEQIGRASCRERV